MRIKETNVKRLPGTLRGSANADLGQRAKQGISEIKADAVEIADSNDLLLINHESIVRSWKPAKRNGCTDDGLHFSADLLNRIGNVTNCRIELALDEIDLLVRGENKEDVEKAIAKLNVLNDSAVSFNVLVFAFVLISKICQARMASIFDFYVPEGGIDVVLQMVSLKDNSSRKLSTTLLSPSSPHFKLAHNFMTIEMISEGGIDLDRKVRPRPLSQQQSLLWRDHPYQTYGDGSYNVENYMHGPKVTPRSNEGSSNSIEKPAVPNMQPIDQWVEESAAAAENPFAPIDHTGDSEKVQAAADGFQAQPVPPTGRIRHVKVRIAKGIETLPEIAPSVATSCDDKIHINTGSTSRSPSKSGSRTGDEHGSRKTDASTSIESAVSQAAMPTPTFAPPPIEPPFMPEQLDTSDDSYLHEKPTWDVRVVPRFQKDASLLGFDPSEAFREQPKEQASAGARRDIAPMGNRGSLKHVGGQGTNPLNGKEELQQFIGGSTKAFDIKDRVQEVNEVATRQFKYTMNQQKAQNQVASGNFALLKSFESSAAQLLEWTRSHAEQIKLEVHLGRILINHQTGSADFRNQPFQPRQWPQVFPTHEGSRKLETVFTEM